MSTYKDLDMDALLLRYVCKIVQWTTYQFQMQWSCMLCQTSTKALTIYCLDECSDVVKIFVNPIWTYNATADINRHGS